MNKTAIKNFAVWARQKLISDISYKASLLGITEDGIADKLPQSTNDLHFYDIGTKDYVKITGKEIVQRSALVSAIKQKEKDVQNYTDAFQYVVEEVAYTWFNRLVAIRFMEVNDYLPSGVRVLSSENRAKNEPDFVTSPFDTDLEFTPYEQDRVIQLKDENKLDELFRMLFIKQCNKLHDILPELFEKTDDYSELLLTISFTDKDGIVYHLVHDIDEDDFNVEKEGQVEIIGWMYQYYNIEPKAAVFARAKGEKISKEKIPAATQLFTPDWIVRYMVENSLGRIWIEGHPNNSLRDSWKYYIDEAKQESEIATKLDKIKEAYKSLRPDMIKIIDPCMGSGHVLVYAFDVLMQIYESYGYPQRDAARSILANNIYGTDIDKRAYQLAYFAVMMKARQYNRRILKEDIKPNLCFIKNSKSISEQALDKMDDCREITQQLVAEFVNAAEYGSALKVSLSESDLLKISNQIEYAENHVNESDLFDIIGTKELTSVLRPLVMQALLLVQKYDIVVTNPPYMPLSNAGTKLNDYIKKNYPDSKTDLFAVFIERCQEMLKPNGYQAMITMHSWMFLSSYEKLREKLLSITIVNMAHLGARAFEEIGGEVVQTTSFVIRKSHIADYKGEYCRLVEPTSQRGKEDMFLAGENRYAADQSNFSKIPGSPVAYWISEGLFNAFANAKQLGDVCETKKGLATSDNNRFLRLWFEPLMNNIVFDCVSNESTKALAKKWYPINKGGEFNRWYGNRDYVINWANDGYEIRNFRDDNGKLLSRPQNTQYNFRQALTWSKITSGTFSARFCEGGFLFDDAAAICYSSNNILLYKILGFLNSKCCQCALAVLNPTINIQIGDIGHLPILNYEDTLVSLVQDCISLSRTDWDSYETSWDFKRNPMLAKGKLADAYIAWKADCESRFLQLKTNEEELNSIFIDIYGLQDELTPDVADKDVTVHRIFDTKEDVPESMKGSNYVRTMHDEIVSLVSYAVGCMFGRYSLERERVVYAGGNFDDVYWKYKGQAALDKNGEAIEGGYAGISLADYHYPKFHDTDDWKTATELSFEPDADNCIPITDEEYFEDDIVGLFCAWLKKVYGEDTLEENLDFIANALGNKGKTSREVIRNYFLTDFIKDHIKTYQKRPIYWLFDSGKQNGFKALVYMHRWNADTIGNVRVEYLHRIQRVYEKEITRMQEIIDNSHDNKEISNVTKRKEKLQKQYKETKDYDAKVAHLALSRIDIDLDDGVKVNYEKVQTADGKKMQILARI